MSSVRFYHYHKCSWEPPQVHSVFVRWLGDTIGHTHNGSTEGTDLVGYAGAVGGVPSHTHRLQADAEETGFDMNYGQEATT